MTFTFSAETATKIIKLNIGKTAVTNVGIRNLCFGDDYGPTGMYACRCPDLIILEVSGTRVTECGGLIDSFRHARHIYNIFKIHNSIIVVFTTFNCNQ